VEYHARPGGHDFDTWTPALQEALPWAAARLVP
jgi:S-formylglutathione hydrolase FrmB